MGFIYITEKDLARTREKDKRKKDTKNNLKFLSCILFLLVSIAVIAILGIEDPMKRFIVRNQFIKALKERFDKEKIEISWPIRKVYQMK